MVHEPEPDPFAYLREGRKPHEFAHRSFEDVNVAIRGTSLENPMPEASIFNDNEVYRGRERGMHWNNTSSQHSSHANTLFGAKKPAKRVPFRPLDDVYATMRINLGQCEATGFGPKTTATPVAPVRLTPRKLLWRKLQDISARYEKRYSFLPKGWGLVAPVFSILVIISLLSALVASHH